MSIMDDRMRDAERRARRMSQTPLSKGLGPSKTYRVSRDTHSDAAVAGCTGCALFLWVVYFCAFIAFWVIVAVALLHYIHGN